MKDKIIDILNYFDKHPAALNMGAEKIAYRTKRSADDVRYAKKVYKDNLFKEKEVVKPKAKILLLDIETAPMKAYVWSRWKQNIYLDQTISEWFMLTWAAKWLDDDEVMSDRLSPEEAIAENDERLVYGLWQLLNEAQIIIAHNGKKFDEPKIKSRFIVHGYPPTTPYKQIDTLEVSKRQFGFSSNKLDALATYFGIPNKLETNFNLWKECLNGNPDALVSMELYNRMDVTILEKVYLVLRPYIKGHINVGLLTDEANVCPHCGSKDINEIENKFSFNNTTLTKLYRCTSCGAVSRGAKNEYPKEFKKSLIRPI